MAVLLVVHRKMSLRSRSVCIDRVPDRASQKMEDLLVSPLWLADGVREGSYLVELKFSIYHMPRSTNDGDNAERLSHNKRNQQSSGGGGLFVRWLQQTAPQAACTP